MYGLDSPLIWSWHSSTICFSFKTSSMVLGSCVYWLMTGNKPGNFFHWRHGGRWTLFNSVAIELRFLLFYGIQNFKWGFLETNGKTLLIIIKFMTWHCQKEEEEDKNPLTIDLWRDYVNNQMILLNNISSLLLFWLLSLFTVVMLLFTNENGLVNNFPSELGQWCLISLFFILNYSCSLF